MKLLPNQPSKLFNKLLIEIDAHGFTPSKVDMPTSSALDSREACAAAKTCFGLYAAFLLILFRTRAFSPLVSLIHLSRSPPHNRSSFSLNSWVASVFLKFSRALLIRST